PPKCLELLQELSAFGVHPAHYSGHGCTGCGICFYCCPAPGAIGWPHLRSGRAWGRREGDMRQLRKGKVRGVKSAPLAGCSAYYGYPITPASEIAEARRCICRKSKAHSCKRKAKSPPSTWCTAQLRPGSAS